MATETYPLDLDDLKRQIDQAEQIDLNLNVTGLTVEEAVPYDGINAPASFVVLIGYYPPKLSTTLTKTDGSTTVVGNEQE